jgi:hypothetical protein
MLEKRNMMRNPVQKLISPLEMLASDHETVKLLFDQCEHTDPGMKRQLLSQEIFKNLAKIWKYTPPWKRKSFTPLFKNI